MSQLISLHELPQLWKPQLIPDEDSDRSVQTVKKRDTWRIDLNLRYFYATQHGL